MKYTTSHLMALMLAVACLCAVGRLVGVDAAIGVVLMVGFFLAPSVLAFALSPFKSISVDTRRQVTLGVLIAFGIPAAILAGIVVNPALGAFLVVFALAIWTPQFALLADIRST